MLKAFSLIICFCSINFPTISSSIEQIHLIFRHGERFPTKIFPNDIHKVKYSNELGYLTNNGKLQVYNLGQRIREKYKDYIPEYYFSKDVKIISSYADRCLASAQLFASGLFPPKDEQIWNDDLLWQPIPISYKPRAEDNIIAQTRPCPKYQKIYEEFLNSEKHKEVIQEYSKLFEYLTEHTGMKVETIRQVEDLYSTLEIHQSNNWTLPQWTRSVFPIPMKYVANISIKSFTETDYMRRIKGGPFLKEMLREMISALNHETIPKLFVYSGHDMTIANVLRTLKLVDFIKPYFAAYLIFELYDDGEIKIVYSNSGWEDETELVAINCSDPCTLQSFETSIKDMTPSKWDVECEHSFKNI